MIFSNHFETAPGAEFSTTTASRITNINQARVRTALNSLSRKGYLSIDTSHKTYRYLSQLLLPINNNYRKPVKSMS